MGEAAAETLSNQGVKSKRQKYPKKHNVRTPCDGRNGIQLAAVGSRNVLHMGNVLQPPFYLGEEAPASAGLPALCFGSGLSKRAGACRGRLFSCRHLPG